MKDSIYEYAWTSYEYFFEGTSYEWEVVVIFSDATESQIWVFNRGKLCCIVLERLLGSNTLWRVLTHDDVNYGLCCYYFWDMSLSRWKSSKKREEQARLCRTSPYVIWKDIYNPVLTSYNSPITAWGECFESQYIIDMQNNICVVCWQTSQDTSLTIFELDPERWVRIWQKKYLHWTLTNVSGYNKDCMTNVYPSLY